MKRIGHRQDACFCVWIRRRVLRRASQREFQRAVNGLGTAVGEEHWIETRPVHKLRRGP
jgi:hypothetical protein